MNRGIVSLLLIFSLFLPKAGVVLKKPGRYNPQFPKSAQYMVAKSK
jgi:hypothetical protein